MDSRHRIGVCTWSLQPRSPDELIDSVNETGLRTVQLALSPIIRDRQNWSSVFDRLKEAGITVASGMMDMAGEDYSSIESITRTGGVRPDDTWPENEAHARDVAALAEQHDIPLVTFHAGFPPDDPTHPERAVLLDRIGRVVDIFAHHGVSVGLETGQESAASLREILAELDRPDVGVNFDPANMILYGSGDPIEALATLIDHIRQVHIKDACFADQPGRWGRETVVGVGSVDWSRFLDMLMTSTEPMDLIIEREAGHDRIADVVIARDVIRTSIPPEFERDSDSHRT